MIEDFFEQKCNIYHLMSEKVDYGYGIDITTERAYKYSDKPNEILVPCHFTLSSQIGEKVYQGRPMSTLDGDVKVAFPVGTDIRINDKITLLSGIDNAQQWREVEEDYPVWKDTDGKKWSEFSIVEGKILDFFANNPRKVREHHIVVIARRNEKVDKL